MTQLTGGGSFTLAPGRHQLPFSFQLPNQIPSSFEGTNGHVRYSIKAFLKGGFMKSDYRRDISFQVNTVVDFNKNFEAAVNYLFIKIRFSKSTNFLIYVYKYQMMPQQKSAIKERFFGGGLIKATAKIDRTGYSIGETINFNARIENLSGKSCPKSTIQIIQVIWCNVIPFQLQ